ncbi:MAG: hypothetical protein ACJ8GL_05405 [Bacillus sp. (in: firmicutes)]
MYNFGLQVSKAADYRRAAAKVRFWEGIDLPAASENERFKCLDKAQLSVDIGDSSVIPKIVSVSNVERSKKDETSLLK